MERSTTKRGAQGGRLRGLRERRASEQARTFAAGRRPTALITGASSGIGLELARTFAGHDHDLVIVARRAQVLREVAREIEATHQVRVRVFREDLREPHAPKRLFDRCAAAGLDVDVLVNNAGYGAFGEFAEIDRELQTGIVDLNARAVVDLTHLFLQPMLARGRGRILNVASVASFQASPRLAVYAASKAFVLSFSEALDTELCGTGVTVTALCPGPTATGFASTADMEGALFFAIGTMSARDVAGAGYDAAMAGKPLVVPGATNWLSTQVVALLPRTLTRRLVHALQVKLPSRMRCSD